MHDKKDENGAAKMAWKLFEQTGSISYYMLYHDLMRRWHRGERRGMDVKTEAIVLQAIDYKDNDKNFVKIYVKKMLKARFLLANSLILSYN